MYVQQPLTGRAGLIPGPAFTAAVGEARSLAQSTTIASGAVIEGADVTIRANASNTFDVTSRARIKGLAKVANTGIAAAVVVSNIDSDAIVTIGGTIRDHRRPLDLGQSRSASTTTARQGPA